MGMHVDSSTSEIVSLPTFTSTPYGFYARLPVLTLPNGISIAILFCSIREDPLGLVLNPCPDALDPKLPLFHTAEPHKRIVRIRSLLQSHVVPLGIPKTIYFAHRPPPRLDADLPRTLALINGGLFAPFRIPEVHLRTLGTEQSVRVLYATDVPFPWSGTPPLALALENRSLSRKYFWILRLGRCTVPAHGNGASSSGTIGVGNGQRHSLGPHWASMEQLSYQYNELPTAPPVSTHSCPGDHICEWKDGKRTFTAYYPGWIPIVVSFTKCPMNPTGETLVLNIDFKPIVRMS